MSQSTQSAETTHASRLPAQVQWSTPRANIRENKDAFLLELEMPGVQKEGLEITVEANELTIVGHRADAEPKGEVVYRESRAHDYRRVFDLDPSIDTGKIAARMEQGVLMLTLPKMENMKPRKIAVEA
jgi:HSP20 family protein